MEKFYKNALVLCFILLLTAGCYSISEKPKELLSKEIVATTLWKIYLYNNYNLALDNIINVDRYDIKSAVIVKSNIDETTFDESLAYYSLNPDDFKVILEIINDSIEVNKLE